MNIINEIPLEFIDKIPKSIKNPTSYTLRTLGYLRWLASGKKGLTPHLIKIKTLKSHGQEFDCTVFIETGTFLGDTLYAMKNNFKRLYSIEIDEMLYQRAKNRFREVKEIQIIKGDSAKVLPIVIKKLRTSSNCLFWLDAHYSGSITAKADIDTPIVKELESIIKLKLKNPVILIDDAKDFNGTHDYPKITWLKKYIKEKLPNYNLLIKDNIIRITPKL